MQETKAPNEIAYTNISNFDEKQCFSVEKLANPSKRYQLRRFSTDIANLNILKKVASILATFFSIYFVFKTSFLAFIFSPATESSIFPGLSPALNITRAEPWKRLRWMVFSNWVFPI